MTGVAESRQIAGIECQPLHPRGVALNRNGTDVMYFRGGCHHSLRGTVRAEGVTSQKECASALC